MNKIQIYDTTLRDGTQAEGISLSLNDKLMLAKRLDAFGIAYIEGGWPGSNPKDLAFFKEVKKLRLRRSKIAAFGATRRPHRKASADEQVRILLEAGTKTITIFGKSWDFHVREVFKISLKENLQMISDTVRYLKSKKREVIFDAEHFFDGFSDNPSYAVQTIREAEKAGAGVICLCDTNGGAVPHRIAVAMKRVRKAVRVPLAIHVHNDGELAVANSMTAVERGAAQVQGTINGYGERCGNANLTSLIPLLQLKLGFRVVPDKKLKELSDLSRFVAEICNMPVTGNQPFTGRSAFAHKGGVHVNAMAKNRKTYEHIDPAAVGNQTRFLVSELSGKSNVLLKSNALHLGLTKETPGTRAILKKIQDLENEGYQFEAAEASFELLMKKELGKYRELFRILEIRVFDEKIGSDKSTSKAIVKIQVGNETEHMTADGDGPVNALDGAFRKALRKFYPQVEKIQLRDYKVRVVNSQAGTAARVRVFIQFQDGKEAWSTVGVSENVIEASWLALIDGIEYKLLKS